MKDSFDRLKNRIPKNILSWLFVVLAGIAFYFVLQNLSLILGGIAWFFSLLSPFILGFAFAYLLYPLSSFIENKICLRLWPNKHRLARKLGVFSALLLVFMVILSLFLLVLPETIENLDTLINQLPSYANETINFINEKLQEYHIAADMVEQFKLSSQKLVANVSTYLMDSLPSLVNFSSRLTSGLANLGIAVVAAVYLLLGRERFKGQAKKLLYAFVKAPRAERVIQITRLADKTFSGYITAQLTDAFIVGALCFIGLSLIRMPYAALISTLIGAMNLIPFFGPIIGAVPSTLIILITAPDKVIWLLIFIILLQQIDGNLINPQLVGDRVGLPPIWVMMAIVVCGGIFGIVGVLTGVPIFAAVYVLMEGLIHRRLAEREVPEELLREETRPKTPGKGFGWLPAWLRKPLGKRKKGPRRNKADKETEEEPKDPDHSDRPLP